MHDVKMRGALRHFITKILQDDLPTLAASLAYYSALSMAPLAVVTILILSYLPASVEDMIEQIQMVFGPQAAGLASQIFQQSVEPSLRSWAGVGSVLLSVVFASAMFAQLQVSLNRIFELKTQPIHRWFFKRLQTVGFVFVLILFLFLSSFVMKIFSHFSGWFSWTSEAARLLLTVLSPCLLLYWLPERKVSWLAALCGGVITGLLFEIGNRGFGFYLGNTAVASAYGAMGTLMIFLLWIYYSALILLFGAEVAFALRSIRWRV
jgi:membrane protein